MSEPNTPLVAASTPATASAGEVEGSAATGAGASVAEPIGLSIVAPCFNEEQGLSTFLDRTRSASEASGLSYEIVLVDDGSRDGTWARMVEAAEADPRVRAFRLSRNFGHQRALSAGLAQARGDRVLLIDADLQDPPEALLPMLNVMTAEGADVVYGQRRQRSGEGWFKRATAGLFYRALRWLSATDIPADTGDFRLLTAAMVARLNAMPEQHRFLRGMIAWLGGTQVAYPYDREPRTAGQSGYPLGRMLSFAVDGVTGFSVAPLRLCLALAGVSLLVALGVLAYVVGSVLGGTAVQGWASLAVILLFFQSVQLLCIGLVGEYVGRLFMEQKGRPLYVIVDRAGADEAV